MTSGVCGMGGYGGNRRVLDDDNEDAEADVVPQVHDHEDAEADVVPPGQVEVAYSLS